MLSSRFARPLLYQVQGKAYAIDLTAHGHVLLCFFLKLQFLDLDDDVIIPAPIASCVVQLVW